MTTKEAMGRFHVRRDAVMANSYTYKMALADAIALAKEAGKTECAEKLSLLSASLVKKANAPKSPSKAQLQNRAIAKELLAKMPNDEPVGTTWAMERGLGILTPQKATAIFKLLVADGVVEKTEPINGKVHYRKM